MSRAHMHLTVAAEARESEAKALQHAFGSRCPDDCKADWRCQQGRHLLDHEPEPLPFLDFSPLEALGYAVAVVAVPLLYVFRDWINS